MVPSRCEAALARVLPEAPLPVIEADAELRGARVRQGCVGRLRRVRVEVGEGGLVDRRMDAGEFEGKRRPFVPRRGAGGSQMEDAGLARLRQCLDGGGEGSGPGGAGTLIGDYRQARPLLRRGDDLRGEVVAA